MKTVLKAGAVLSLMTALHAGGEGWMTDFEAAKAKAAKEGKDLFVDFTGSDWCGWCIKLNKEVFVHDAFKEGVKDKFVLVELDYPRDKSKISKETQEQNKKLKEVYPVRGYPTILLLDAQGRPYAKTGYRRGGPKPYVEHLDELQATKMKRDEALAKAPKAEGVEKAKALIAALEAISISDDMISAFYGDLLEQIKAADPEDASGFVKGIEQKEQVEEFRQELSQLARKKDMEGALKLVDKTMAELDFDELETQRMIMTKAMIYANMQRLDEALDHVDKALAACPEGEFNDGIKKVRQQLMDAKAKADQEALKAEQTDEPEAQDVKEAKEAPKEADKAEQGK